MFATTTLFAALFRGGLPPASRELTLGSTTQITLYSAHVFLLLTSRRRLDTPSHHPKIIGSPGTGLLYHPFQIGVKSRNAAGYLPLAAGLTLATTALLAPISAATLAAGLAAGLATDLAAQTLAGSALHYPFRASSFGHVFLLLDNNSVKRDFITYAGITSNLQ